MSTKAYYNIVVVQETDFKQNNIITGRKEKFRLRSKKDGSNEDVLAKHFAPIFDLISLGDLEALCFARYKLFNETGGYKGWSKLDVISVLQKNGRSVEKINQNIAKWDRIIGEEK